MNKYPIVSGKRLIKALKKAGYVIHKGRRGKGRVVSLAKQNEYNLKDIWGTLRRRAFTYSERFFQFSNNYR